MKRADRSSNDEEIDALACDWVIRRDMGLTAGEAAEFAAWREADPRHAAAVDRHDQAWTLLDRPRSGGRGVEMEAALAGRASRRRRRRVATVAAVAACAVLLVASATLWRDAPRTDARGSVATAVVREPEKRVLADGSSIELKPGAVVRVDYSAARRGVVLESGEALFQVAKDAARPFVVTAGATQVRAVGTAFLVERGATEVDVIVTEGMVAVERSSPPIGAPGRARDAEPMAQLTAGRRVRWPDGAAGGVPAVADISPEEIAERLLWRARRLEFSDTPLAEALALINRHSQTQVRIEDPALGALLVTGIFRAGNTDTFIRLLEANFGMTAERAGETITLRRKR